MRSIFCTNCGAKIEYSSAKPKFCSSCGEPMSSSVAARLPNKARSRKIEELDDGQTDATEVPSISSIEYDIEVPRDNMFKLGDILDERQEGK